MTQPERPRKTILVIDDEPDFRAEIKEWLSEMGYFVLTAANGPEALLHLKTVSPNLVLLDVSMPEMDGLEVLSSMKRNHASSQVPVVMLSARTGSDFILRSRELQASDYVTKPFQEEDLLQIIRRCER